MPRVARPNWKQGFAHHAAESANPNLRRGALTILAPLLGSTGARLVDVSGTPYIHGSLEDMSPATAWIMTDRGWALDYSGADDHIEMDAYPHNQNVFSWWTEVRRGTTGRETLASKGGTGSSGDKILEFNVSDHVRFFVRTDGTLPDFASSDTITDTDWHQIAMTFDGLTVRGYIDGVDVGNSVGTGSVADDSESLMQIFARNGGGIPMQGQGTIFAAWNRVLVLNEIQQLWADSAALLHQRRRVPVGTTAAAAPSVAQLFAAMQPHDTLPRKPQLVAIPYS